MKKSFYGSNISVLNSQSKELLKKVYISINYINYINGVLEFQTFAERFKPFHGEKVRKKPNVLILVYNV